MDRQLKICQEKGQALVKFSLDSMHDLTTTAVSDEISNMSCQSQIELVTILQDRCNCLLKCHYEYRQLINHQTLIEAIQNNMSRAVSFALAFIEHLDLKKQWLYLFGNSDPSAELNQGILKRVSPSIVAQREKMTNTDF